VTLRRNCVCNENITRLSEAHTISGNRLVPILGVASFARLAYVKNVPPNRNVHVTTENITTSSQLHDNLPDATTKLPEIEKIGSESGNTHISNMSSASRQDPLWSQQSHSRRFVVWGGW
jgi:hypothetical protein